MDSKTLAKKIDNQVYIINGLLNQVEPMKLDSNDTILFHRIKADVKVNAVTKATKLLVDRYHLSVLMMKNNSFLKQRYQKLFSELKIMGYLVNYKNDIVQVNYENDIVHHSDS